MRISDWSSDVCSSDLVQQVFEPLVLAAAKRRQVHPLGFGQQAAELHQQQVQVLDHTGHVLRVERQRLVEVAQHADEIDDQATGRSEEHTSELQSLMRISYAVFCLKKTITQ